MAWQTGHIPIVEREAREDTRPKPAPIEVTPVPAKPKEKK
jgi:hypothetical protein